MPLESNLFDTALDAMTPRIASVSLHTADPGSTGASEATGLNYSRDTPTWPAASGATVSMTGQLVYQLEAGQEISWLGFWDNTDTWVGSSQLTSAQPFNNDGELTVQSLTINAVNV